MTPLDSLTSVGTWVAEHPRTAKVFEELHVDYCCGGDQTLADACRARNLDTAEVLAKLASIATQADVADDEDWNRGSLGELCDHIERTHHAYLWGELPRLTNLIGRVIQAHGAEHPDLAELKSTFELLRAELEPHMLKEERVLFPAIRQLEQAAALDGFPFGTIEHPIRMMEHEHDFAGAALQRIREQTANFHLPDDACQTWRVLWADLQFLELDLHQHIHKENNILFPRALCLESSSMSA